MDYSHHLADMQTLEKRLNHACALHDLDTVDAMVDEMVERLLGVAQWSQLERIRGRVTG